MTHTATRRAVRGFALLFPLVLAAACSGTDPVDPGCPTCPPDPTDGALRLSIAYVGPQGALEPAGFRPTDVRTVEVTVQGGAQSQHLSLGPTQNGVFLTLLPGTYSVTASAFGDGNILLFSDQAQVTVALADTVDVALEMVAEVGTITVDVDGRTSGMVPAVAGDDLPFTVTVRNTEGRVVAGSVVDVRSSNPTYADAAEQGSDVTDANGQVQGLIRAPYSGTINLSVTVDGRAIPNPVAPTGVTFTTGVSAGASTIVSAIPDPSFSLLFADGQDTYTFTILVQNTHAEPLPRTPITVRSTRNAGVDPGVDILEPASGTWETDELGRLTFTVRSFTSSFFHLGDNGIITSQPSAQFPQGEFVPGVLTIEADGVEIGSRFFRWNSTAFPGPMSAELLADKAVVQANGQDSAVITVTAKKIGALGGGPVVNGYVELTNSIGVVLNETLNIEPLPGYDGFRTNSAGMWQARIRSTTPGFLFLSLKVDGRSMILSSSRLITFQ